MSLPRTSSFTSSPRFSSHVQVSQSKETDIGVPPFSFRKGVEGLRALASLAVVAYHCKTPGFENGFAGVDVFFVISGYLLGSLMLREIAEHHSVDFKRFFSRRVTRLLPMSLIVLLVTAAAARHYLDGMVLIGNRESYRMAAIQFANWGMILSSSDYFAEVALSPVQHFWSLSCDWQFYAIMPPILWILALVSHYNLRSRRLFYLSSAATIGGLFYALKTAPGYPMWVYLGTFGRLYQVMGGVVVSIVAMQYSLPSLEHLASPIGGIVLLIFPLAVYAVPTGASHIVGLISSSLTMVLLLSFEMGADSYITSGLNAAVLRQLGKWSYSLYLWHWPIIILGDAMGFIPPVEFPVVRFAIVLSLSLLLARFSFDTVETFFKGFTITRPVTVILAGIASCAVVALLCGVIVNSDAETWNLYKEKNEALVSAPPKPVIPADKLIPAATTRPADPFGDEMPQGSVKHKYYLGGDSIAGGVLVHAFNTLSLTHPFEIDLDYRAGANFASSDEIAHARIFDSEKFNGKDQWEAEQHSLAKILKGVRDPTNEAAIISGWYLRLAYEDQAGNLYKPGHPRFYEILEEGLRNSIGLMAEEGKPIILVEHILSPLESIPNCIINNKELGIDESCDQPIDVKIASQHERITVILRDIAAHYSNVHTVSIADMFCSNNLCEAKIPDGKTKGMATWIDPIHPSPKYARYKANAILKAFKDQCIDLDRGVFGCEVDKVNECYATHVECRVVSTTIHVN